MGIAIPQVITDRSGAQVIDASLGFSGTDQKLERTPGSQGNLQTWTWSGWIKLLKLNQEHSIFSSHTGSSDRLHFRISSGQIQFAQNTGSWDFDIRSDALLRDIGWYHIVAIADFTNSTQNDRARLYVNGERQTLATNTLPSNTTTNTIVNATKAHYIGEARSSTDYYGRMSQVYLIDGQALGPEYFGFTDPLTNTWKPKKYTGTFGTNGFWLPMDGNSPIGQDQSGNGNDWTPVNFGGSLELDNPNVSGARPILNTTQGGTQAGVGVFGSKQNVGYAVTVYNDGGGNKYYIDGVKQDTVTGLIRGATYTFDTSDSTVSSHPFRFSATSNGSHGGGSEYTNGVAAITGAATTITVPHDAPNTLYYYCTSHSGMGADITGITTNEKLADQYAWKNIAALPLVGSRGDVSASIACTSTTKTITASNTSHPNTQSNFYSGSIYFDDTADEYISFPGAVFSGEFCVEFWYYANALATSNGTVSVPLSGDTLDQFQVGHTSSNGIEFWYDGSLRAQSGAIALNKWYHIALTRDSSNVLKLYVDGVQKGNTPTVSTSETVTTFYLGVQYRSGNADYHRTNGYVQDFRIYNGTVKYSSNFVVPATSPDILPDTPSGVSGGSKLTKITDGAVHFDGTGDYLSVADSDDFDLAGNNWTIEAFVYHSNTNYLAYEGIMAQWALGSGTARTWTLETVGSGATSDLEFYYYDTSNNFVGPVQGGTLSKNRWHHVAACRSGNTIRMFIDGVMHGSGTSISVNIKNSTDPLTVGGGVAVINNSTGNWNGFISNARLVNGTALYTKNFTPPTAPLTNVTNTKLLCCQSNTFAGSAAVSPTPTAAVLNLPLSSTPFSDSSATSATITNTGSITTTSAGTNSFNITNAASLDGSSQRITTNNTNISFQNEWTVDIYFKLDSSASGYNALINSGYGSQTSNYMYIGLDDDEKPYIETSSSGSATTASDALSKNVWYHGRVTQDGSNITFYINGESVVTKTAQTTDLSSAGTFTIGSLLDNGNNANNFHGLIGPVRVINSDIGTPLPNGEATSSGTLSNSTTRNLNVFGDTAATNFTPFNTDINTVRGQESGYATLNPLNMHNSNNSLSNGNLEFTTSGSDGGLQESTLAMSSGKFYFEVVYSRSDTGQFAGIRKPGARNYNDSYIYVGTGNKYTDGGSSAGYGDALAHGDVIGTAFDADNGTLEFFKNGQSQGQAFSGISGTYSFFVGSFGGPPTGIVNFGQKPFKFPSPDGFSALNIAATRPVKVISRPDQYVGVTTYAGDGTSVVVSDYQFKPDFVWIKGYTDPDRHGLYDTVRGVTKRLQSSESNAEDTQNGVMSFDDKGFSVGDYAETNGSGRGYVAWAWRAGGAPTATNNNTSGAMDANSVSVDGVLQSAYTPSGSPTIYPTGMSVGTKQGFSIIRYQANSTAGATIPHGLSQSPTFVLVKSLETAGSANSDWTVFHSTLGGTKAMYLNEQLGSGSTGSWNNTDPNANVITLGTAHVSNLSPNHYIAYAWHDVPGLQKFGSYGGADAFVELGFRPAVLIIKSETGSRNWIIIDSARDAFNPSDRALLVNDSAAEDDNSVYAIDFLSNGFKVRGSNGQIDGDSSYIYAAWAEAPTVDLFGGGANAR